MESLFIIIVFGGFFVILIGSVMGIIAYSQVGKLQSEIRALKLSLKAPAAFGQSETPQPSVKPAPVMPSPPTPKPVAATAKGPEKQDAAFAPLSPLSPVQKTPAKPSAAPPEKTPTHAKTPKASAKPRRSFEEAIGAQWTVWVGGLALLLGAVFLLRYTIEAGFFTPAMRIIMAALFGAGLLAAGEFLRRADPKIMGKLDAKSAANAAYIPGILTAVGIFSLLGTVYAAYALYGFIGPMAAFALMGLISLGGLAFGLLHGPSLAALGLAASLATPLLIQTEEPNAYILYLYLAIVSAASLSLARLRNWGPLTIFTLFGALGWIFLSLDATKAHGTFAAWLAFTGVMFTISTIIAAKSKTEDGAIDLNMKTPYGPLIAMVWGGLAAFAVLKAAVLNDFVNPHYYAGLGIALILMATGWKFPRQYAHIITGSILAAAFIFIRALTVRSAAEVYAATAIFSAVFIWLCFTRQTLPQTRTGSQKTVSQREQFWSFFGSYGPLILLLMLSIEDFEIEYLTAASLVILTFVNAAQAYMAYKRTEGGTNAASVYILGAGIAYVFAVMTELDNMAVSLAFMAGTAIFALATLKLPLSMTRRIAAGFALLVAGHVLFSQIPMEGAVGTAFIFNELWIYLALPAVICAASAWLMSRQKHDLWSEGLKALALAFTALFAVFQIRHTMNGGYLLSPQISLEELALQVLVGLSFTLGGSLISSQALTAKPDLHDRLIPALAVGVSLLTLAVFVIGVCLDKNPLFDQFTEIRGGFILNSLSLAYFLPALLLGGIAVLSKGKRPQPYVQGVAALSLTAFMLYVTSMIRKAFSCVELSIFDNPPEGFELYAMSAVWLVIGIALLVTGLKTRRKDLRLASGVIITLTVLKAFLIDMASLEGVLRAMSFVVLGLVLIVIGRAYQRMLASEKPAASAG